jgi:hypothetical protein
MDRDKMDRLCTAMKTATFDPSRTEDMTPLEVVTAAIWQVADLFAAYVYEADHVGWSGRTNHQGARGYP